jgi:predicted lipid-binding transport protein (Tim44 family)
MSTTHRSTLLLLASSLLVSCASIPSGPSVMVLPGTGKDFDQFRDDDAYCRLYANEQARGETANRASIKSGVGTAAVGTGVGAAAGAAMGGGTGAAIGAGSGLVLGSLMGANTASVSGAFRQQRYDMSYTQCMYGKGHRVPISGQIMDNSGNRTSGTTQPLPGTATTPPPPPPPGNPPPPPPQ